MRVAGAFLAIGLSIGLCIAVWVVFLPLVLDRLDRYGVKDLGVMLGIAVVYFLPGIVSDCRRCARSGGIWILNLFLGWTFIGWVGALIWAVIDTPKPALDSR